MKAILLAGGSGTRLYPCTIATNKHLIPISGKPMIYYSLSTLLLAGSTEVLVVTSPDYIESFRKLLSPLSQLGLKIYFGVQKKPAGISDGIKVSEHFLKNESFLLALGDNIFIGPKLSQKLLALTNNPSPCSLLLYAVDNPSQLGVAVLKNGSITEIVEKPKKFISKYAITGLYHFSSTAIEIVKNLKNSSRGELEITDLIRNYLNKKEVSFEIADRGYVWMDAGTLDDIRQADRLVSSLEQQQGYLVGSPEEILLGKGFCTKKDLSRYLDKLPLNNYTEYLRKKAT